MTKTQLEIIIQEGESYKVEFKESVDKTLVEEVCAFANASGGRLFIGISDNGKISGTDTSNVARSRIQDTIRQIQPDIPIAIEVFENVIILTIPKAKINLIVVQRDSFLELVRTLRNLTGMK